MNNLPNTERKCRNVDSFLAFLLIRMLVVYSPIRAGTRDKKHYTECSE